MKSTIKNKRGNLNVAMGMRYPSVVKAAKISGMTPTMFARIVVADAADGVTSGRLRIKSPQLLTTDVP